MKRQLITPVLVIGAFILAAATLPKSPSPATEKTFTLTISQKGIPLEIKNNAIELDKAAFDIVFEFSEPMGVLIHASFDARTFDLASQGVRFDSLPGFQGTGMAEGTLNTNREIFLSSDAPNYWYYDSKKEHRFNKVKQSKRGILCNRTIENLFDIDTDTKWKISEVDKALYLVVISYKRGEGQKEIQRQYLKINWRK